MRYLFMSIRDESRVFSVPIDLIVRGVKLPFDLYINSSKSDNSHFVKIFASGESITLKELKTFKKKYFQLYISEDQRSDYLSSLVQNPDLEDEKKVEVVKDSAVKYLDKVFDTDREFTTELIEEAIEGCKESVEQMVSVVKGYEIGDLRKLIGNLSFHDFYTFDHSVNVSMYAVIIFKALKPEASDEEMTLAGLSGMLHDIGKIKMPTDLINKAGKLDEEEFNIIKSHPRFGKELIETQNCDCEGIDFDIIKRVVFEHHENFNGTGYPNKIEGKDIHIFARIVAIADFFDAITTKRSYHDVLSTPDALAVMARTKGKKLDPHLFDVFTKTVHSFGTGKENRALAEGYDPCQPQNKLPFEEVKANKQDHNLFGGEKKKEYGAVQKEDPAKKKKVA